MLPLLQLAALLWLNPAEPVQRYDVIELRIEYQTRHLGLPIRSTVPTNSRKVTLYGWNHDPKFGWYRDHYSFVLDDRYRWSIERIGRTKRLNVPSGSFMVDPMESSRWVRHIVHEDANADGAMRAWLGGRN